MENYNTKHTSHEAVPENHTALLEFSHTEILEYYDPQYKYTTMGGGEGGVPTLQFHKRTFQCSQNMSLQLKIT